MWQLYLLCDSIGGRYFEQLGPVYLLKFDSISINRFFLLFSHDCLAQQITVSRLTRSIHKELFELGRVNGNLWGQRLVHIIRLDPNLKIEINLVVFYLEIWWLHPRISVLLIPKHKLSWECWLHWLNRRVLNELAGFSLKMRFVLKTNHTPLRLPKHFVELRGDCLSKHFIHFLQSKRLVLIVDILEPLPFDLLKSLIMNWVFQKPLLELNRLRQKFCLAEQLIRGRALNPLIFVHDGWWKCTLLSLVGLSGPSFVWGVKAGLKALGAENLAHIDWAWDAIFQDVWILLVLIPVAAESGLGVQVLQEIGRALLGLELIRSHGWIHVL